MAGESMEGSFQVIKLLSRRPTQWDHCLSLARLKFDKYFKRKVLKLSCRNSYFIVVYLVLMTAIIFGFWIIHFSSKIKCVCGMCLQHPIFTLIFQALQLLHSFPLDTRLKDGSKSHPCSLVQRNCIKSQRSRLCPSEVFSSVFRSILAVSQTTAFSYRVWPQWPSVSIWVNILFIDCFSQWQREQWLKG